MSFFGVVINTIPIFIFLSLINHDLKHVLFLVFFLNLAIGPFFVVNLYQIDMPQVGRFDFFVFNIYATYLLYRNVFSKNNTIILYLLFCLVVLFFEFIFDQLSLYARIDIYYGYFSRILQGIVIYFIYSESRSNFPNVVKIVTTIVILLHLFLSITQFLFPLYIRSGTAEAGLTFGGFVINRPTGLFESSFVYGVNTIFLCFFYLRVVGFSRFSKFVVLLLVGISLLSTRSNVLSLLISLFVFYFSSSKFRISIFYLLMVSFLIFTFSNNLLIHADQSNTTKFLLWYLTFSNFVHESTFFSLLFGHGVLSSENIASSLPDFVADLAYNVTYDNRVDDGYTSFPIHNVYLQMLYENGLSIFILFIGLILTALHKCVSYEKSFITIILIFTIFVNYFLHNGLFSPFLTFLCVYAMEKKYDT